MQNPSAAAAVLERRYTAEERASRERWGRAVQDEWDATRDVLLIAKLLLKGRASREQLVTALQAVDDARARKSEAMR